jgi:hypothetical protein
MPGLEPGILVLMPWPIAFASLIVISWQQNRG